VNSSLQLFCWRLFPYALSAVAKTSRETNTMTHIRIIRQEGMIQSSLYSAVHRAMPLISPSSNFVIFRNSEKCEGQKFESGNGTLSWKQRLVGFNVFMVAFHRFATRWLSRIEEGCSKSQVGSYLAHAVGLLSRRRQRS